ncbi:MAG TPA: GNAT family N-acetyltransferase [Acidimicrobiales bacterium]|nr:GNAT family N-acetyltransferase [Acidimicrobiales bacterium]
MRTEVRRIRPEEGQTLKRLRLAALKESPSAFGSTYEAEVLRTDEEWAQWAELGSVAVDRVTFFAVLGDNVVGLVGGYRPDRGGTVVELVSMWTSPEARRTGLGRSLVGAVVDWAMVLAVVSVDLWVAGGNDPAVGDVRSAAVGPGFGDGWPSRLDLRPESGGGPSHGRPTSITMSSRWSFVGWPAARRRGS